MKFVEEVIFLKLHFRKKLQKKKWFKRSMKTLINVVTFIKGYSNKYDGSLKYETTLITDPHQLSRHKTETWNS